jgi:predicted SAM-dependent methyltransferase
MAGFVNVDIREDVDPDVVDDIFTLEKFDNESADLIYACHVLEHVKRVQVLPTLRRWYDVLKTGGKVRIAVPDMEAVFSHYFYWKDLPRIWSSLGGSQRHDYDYHYSHFDFDTLSNLLKITGFKNVERYDWRQTEHWYVDDYSQAYEPHMDKEHGKLISLNVEATKS